MSTNVVTSQPTPTAPSENISLEKPSAPLAENVILSQPLLNGNTDLTTPNTPENVVLTQPMSSENIDDDMLTRGDEERAEKERRRQRNLDFCCFACADSCADDDVFCWYFFCRMLCNGCGHCCEGIARCTDSCCEGCAECCNGCCDGQEGCCSGDCCCDDSGHGGAGADGCCDGDCDCGDCDCDCNCFD